MFCSNNDNYMQDLYFYNQYPNNTYNPCMNNCGSVMQNPNMMNNMNGMYMGQNASPNQNLSNLYPSVYRIIMPVISRVLSNSNCQFFNEDILNNMVDTVYNIVEGQIEYEEEPINRTSINNSENSSSNNNSSNSGSSNTTSRNSETRTVQQVNQNSSGRNVRNDNLLRDIIKILILKELISRRNQQFNQNPFYTRSTI